MCLRFRFWEKGQGARGEEGGLKDEVQDEI